MESAELHQFNILLRGETIIRLTNISQAYFGLRDLPRPGNRCPVLLCNRETSLAMALRGQIEAENRATASDVQ